MSTFAITVGGVKRTLTDIHRGTGLSLSHISQIFSGKKRPSMKATRKITSFLKVGVGELDEILFEVVPLPRTMATEKRGRLEPTSPTA